MKYRLAGSILALTGMALAQAAANRPTLNVKLGLWESTRTTASTPVMIPPEDQARMSPEQLAKMRAMLDSINAKNQGTKVVQQCLRSGEMAKAFGMIDQFPSCTFNFVTATNTKQEIHMACQNGNVKSTAIFLRNVIDMEHVEGSDQTSSSDGTHNTTKNIKFSARWIAADCGAVK